MAVVLDGLNPPMKVVRFECPFQRCAPAAFERAKIGLNLLSVNYIDQIDCLVSNGC